MPIAVLLCAPSPIDHAWDLRLAMKVVSGQQVIPAQSELPIDWRMEKCLWQQSYVTSILGTFYKCKCGIISNNQLSA